MILIQLGMTGRKKYIFKKFADSSNGGIDDRKYFKGIYLRIRMEFRG